MLEIVFFHFYYSTLSIYTPGEGNGSPLQYYCLENPVDRKAWQATIRLQKSDTTEATEHTCTQGCNVQHDNYNYHCYMLCVKVLRQ